MSVQPEHTGSGETLHPDIDGLAAGSVLSGAIESSQCAASEIIVLRVVGEVDLCTIPILHAALDASLDQRPAYLVVDLARMTFCSVRGLDLLTQTGRIAAAAATGYAVTGVLPRINRVWTLCWGDDCPVRYRSTAAAFLGIQAAESDVQVHRPRQALAPYPDRKIFNAGATGFPRRA
jgi:anti-anti-sigma regulatory factor